jgi:hypothetical protein
MNSKYKERLQADRDLWFGRVTDWQASGLSQSAYAKLHHLKAGQLCDWVARKKAEDAPKPKQALIPVQIQTPVSQATQACLLLKTAQGHSLTLPAGMPSAWVADLLKHLS